MIFSLFRKKKDSNKRDLSFRDIGGHIMLREDYDALISELKELRSRERKRLENARLAQRRHKERKNRSIAQKLAHSRRKQRMREDQEFLGYDD